MAVGTYAPSSNKIIHWTGADFVSRPSAFPPIHLVQYDRKLPVIAVNLYNNGKTYSLPSNVNVNVLVEKKDGTFISNPVLGCNSERNVVYFEATYQMLYYFGTIKPVIELKMSDSEAASSSAINIIVDKNPVQENSKESSNEYKALEQYINQAKDSANSSKQSATQSANSAEQSAESARQSAAYATQSHNYSVQSASYMSQSAVHEQNARDYLMTIESKPIVGPEPIVDSSGNIITDSDGNAIYGSYRLVTYIELEDIINSIYTKISALTNEDRIIEERVEHLTKTAILDSSY